MNINWLEEVYIPVSPANVPSTIAMANRLREHRELRKEAMLAKKHSPRKQTTKEKLLQDIDDMRGQLGKASDETTLRGLSIMWGMRKSTTDKGKIMKWLQAMEKIAKEIG